MIPPAAPEIAWFEGIASADRPAVGGKGASLGELARAGIRVPPGFVVTTTAFEQFLASIDPGPSIRRMIGTLDPDDLSAISRAASEVRERIRAAPLSAPLQQSIAAALNQLTRAADGTAVAVRSSATSEDSAAASFAGLQHTALWVRGDEAIFTAVRECWASLYSTESVSYRLRLKLPESNCAMGVVVQLMVNSQCSGVMFTRSPTSGDRSVIAIEASWGLGSCIVGGEVTPDHYVVNKVTGDIVNRTVSLKSVRHVPDLAAGGVRSEPVPTEMQNVACLSDGELRELAQIGKRVERHFGAAQDIEWAVARDESAQGIFLLQSRPETVWSGRAPAQAATARDRAYDHVIAALGPKNPGSP